MSDPKPLFQSLRELFLAAGGGHGLLAILVALAGIIYIPFRVSSIEEHDRLQDARLAAIEADAQQRRELLASVAATVQSIDLRCRRIEDALTKH
jgi:Tfp pilus assembly protein PilN